MMARLQIALSADETVKWVALTDLPHGFAFNTEGCEGDLLRKMTDKQEGVLALMYIANFIGKLGYELGAHDTWADGSQWEGDVYVYRFDPRYARSDAAIKRSAQKLYKQYPAEVAFEPFD